MRVFWTEEEKAFVLARYQTQTTVQIATAMNRTRNAVSSLLQRLGLPAYNERYHRWTKHEIAELYQLCDYHSPKGIAKRLGIKQSSVRNKITLLGIRARADVYSVLSATKATGYHEYQLKRARRALGQKWGLEKFKTPRAGKRTKLRFIITTNQLEAMCEYLKTDRLKHQRAA